MTTPNKLPLMSRSHQSMTPNNNRISAAVRNSQQFQQSHSNAAAQVAPPTPSTKIQHAQFLNETHTVLSELNHEFKNSHEEESLIQQIAQKMREVEEVVMKKRMKMKELIQQIIRENQELEKSLENTQPQLALQQQQHEITQQRSVLEQQITSLTSEIAQLELKGEEMDKQKLILQQQKLEVEQAKAKAMPQKVGTMGLYRNFSSIAWDYDADSEAVVKGTFHFDRTKETGAAAIQRFEFQRKETSDFEIANKLWQMMEQ